MSNFDIHMYYCKANIYLGFTDVFSPAFSVKCSSQHHAYAIGHSLHIRLSAKHVLGKSP